MEALTPLLAVALLLATVKTCTDFVAYLSAKQWSPVIKQLIAWGVGVAGAFAIARSDFGGYITLQLSDTATMSLASADKWSIVIFGFAAANAGSLAHNYLQAKDNTQSAYTPPIGPAPGSMNGG